jgi:hypothetical protein
VLVLLINLLTNYLLTRDYDLLSVQSKYLSMPKGQLDQALRIQLEHPLAKVEEQNFIRSRLILLDRQFCIDSNRHLWQTYLDIGTQCRLWSVSIRVLSQSMRERESKSNENICTLCCVCCRMMCKL